MGNEFVGMSIFEKRIHAKLRVFMRSTACVGPFDIAVPF